MGQASIPWSISYNSIDDAYKTVLDKRVRVPPCCVNADYIANLTTYNYVTGIHK
jgi:hypothetical protein